jgi:CheY-like chemotaxis protein
VTGPTIDVLYIEDNPANLRLIERVFALRPSVNLLEATNGHDGMELARAHQPDFVMIDLHLPDVDGAEIVRQLRDDPETGSLCLAIVSADATPSRVEQLLAGGADLYFTKPLDIAELLAAVDRLVEQRSA